MWLEPVVYPASGGDVLLEKFGYNLSKYVPHLYTFHYAADNALDDTLIGTYK